jgi:hypothetical protein
MTGSGTLHGTDIQASVFSAVPELLEPPALQVPGPQAGYSMTSELVQLCPGTPNGKPRCLKGAKESKPTNPTRSPPREFLAALSSDPSFLLFFSPSF